MLPAGGHQVSNLFLIRRNGTHLRQITHGGHAENPAFSPNGRWIAYRTSNDGFGGNVYKLAVRHPAIRRALTHVAGAQFHDPAWSPR